MEPTLFTNRASTPASALTDSLDDSDRAVLLAVAKGSIEHGLEHDCPLAPDLAEYAESLHTIRATFVTLELDHRLQGCIGTLEATRPLVVDVAEHAYAAAFRDPRFPRLRRWELDGLSLHISVLSPATVVPIRNQRSLLATLRPGIDGLTLNYRGQRATFLPSVWDNVPEPEEFLRQLKIKAGLPGDFWSSDLRFETYTTECFP